MFFRVVLITSLFLLGILKTTAVSFRNRVRSSKGKKCHGLNSRGQREGILTGSNKPCQNSQCRVKAKCLAAGCEWQDGPDLGMSSATSIGKCMVPTHQLDVGNKIQKGFQSPPKCMGTVCGNVNDICCQHGATARCLPHGTACEHPLLRTPEMKVVVAGPDEGLNFEAIDTCLVVAAVLQVQNTPGRYMKIGLHLSSPLGASRLDSNNKPISEVNAGKDTDIEINREKLEFRQTVRNELKKLKHSQGGGSIVSVFVAARAGSWTTDLASGYGSTSPLLGGDGEALFQGPDNKQLGTFRKAVHTMVSANEPQIENPIIVDKTFQLMLTFDGHMRYKM